MSPKSSLMPNYVGRVWVPFFETDERQRIEFQYPEDGAVLPTAFTDDRKADRLLPVARVHEAAVRIPGPAVPVRNPPNKESTPFFRDPGVFLYRLGYSVNPGQ